MSDKSKSASQEMGVLLLKGWTMLAESCPICMVPLMQKRPDSEKICVSCNNGPNAAQIAIPSEIKPSQASLEQKERNGMEDIASLISEKMLSGWVLTNQYCPRCTTPLVRSKATAQLLCVACQAPVVNESELKPSSAPAHPQGVIGERVADEKEVSLLGTAAVMQPTESSDRLSNLATPASGTMVGSSRPASLANGIKPVEVEWGGQVRESLLAALVQRSAHLASLSVTDTGLLTAHLDVVQQTLHTLQCLDPEMLRQEVLFVEVERNLGTLAVTLSQTVVAHALQPGAYSGELLRCLERLIVLIHALKLPPQ